MRRVIESKYGYQTNYGGGLLVLVPGRNLVEEETWAKAKAKSPRLRDQLAGQAVVEGNPFVDVFCADLRQKDAAGEALPDPNDLTSDEGAAVADKVEARLLERLLPTAKRAGVRDAFRQALGRS